MTDHDLVSVIVPVYSVEQFLPRCIDSVLTQTHENWELILIDDGSPDRSGDICDEYAANDARIRVIHQDNGGLSVARNTGLEHAAGDYITFVDSDDWLAPDFASAMLRHLVEYDADIAVAGLLRTTDGTVTTPMIPGSVMILDRDETMAKLNGSLHTVLTVACAKLYRASTLEGVSFPPKRLHEDEFTTYRALAASRRVVVSDRQLYFYWQRPDSITGSAPTTRNWSDVVTAYRERQEFLETSFPEDVARLGRVELFRKLMHYRQWLGSDQSDERAAALVELRELAASLQGVRYSVRLFCTVYVRFPVLLDRVLRWRRQLQHA